MMIYVIPKDGDEPIKIVFEGGEESGSIVEDNQVYLIDEHPSSEEVGKAFRTLYARLMSEGSEEVFEKQILKKPINEGHYYLCPCCQNNLGTWDSIFVYKLFMPKYCSNCGCTLDWSEVNAATLTKTTEAIDVKNDGCARCLPQERGLIKSIKKEKTEY